MCLGKVAFQRAVVVFEVSIQVLEVLSVIRCLPRRLRVGVLRSVEGVA
jgi:hypothetical protein